MSPIRTLEEAFLDRIIDEVGDIARTLRSTADKIGRQEIYRGPDGEPDYVSFALTLMHTLENMNVDVRSVVRTCFEAVRAEPITTPTVTAPGRDPVT